jgi:hypothetical protein
MNASGTLQKPPISATKLSNLADVKIKCIVVKRIPKRTSSIP